MDDLKKTCPTCDGDGYLDVMDPDFSGAVIGARPCPACDGDGWVWQGDHACEGVE